MPRIDPQKLLTCISVLLAPNGGIRSSGEVKRLASLMAKYSKKLVSKCIYIQILKCTETDLLGQFMTAGGWSLAHMWLTDGILSKNWPLVQELLELLLLCPVDVARLQSNSAPKLVKGLSREGGNEGVRILATRLVEQWLKIAKGETTTLNSQKSVNNVQEVPVVSVDQTDEPINDYQPEEDPLDIQNENGIDYLTGDETDSKMSSNNGNDSLVFKVTVRNGKQVLAKVTETSPRKGVTVKVSDSDESTEVSDREKSQSGINGMDKKVRDDKDSSRSREHRDKEKSSRDSKSSRDKDRKSSDSHRSSSGKSTSKHSSSSSDKDKHSTSKSSSSSSSHKSSSHKSSSNSSSKSSSHKSSSSSSSRDKDRDKHRSSSSSASKSSSSSKDKEKKDEELKASQADKDKATLAKVLPQSISKMAKIPKKSSTTEEGDSTMPAPKKSSISIEVRKDNESRPKTVKTFNSQFRSHGLAEEAPPPPSRRGLKKPNSSPSPAGATIPSPNITASTTTTLPKRSLSPTLAAKELNEKKVKLESPIVEKPGAIKLIPPKPKPSVLVESDMFMDAISAATIKKDAIRKRKRMTSTSKEAETAAPEKTTASSNVKETKSAAAPMKFYQDTLDESEPKDSKALDDTKKSIIKDADDSEEGIAPKKAKKEGDESSDSESMKDTKDITLKKEADTSDDEQIDVKKPPGPGCGPDGPPGVLTLHHRRKGPKKSIKWRPQESLEEIRFFELDENERVNVTKTFVDMKQMERNTEREGFLIARKLTTEDVMQEQTPWAPLVEIADVPELQSGISSKEKEIQTERERTCLKTIYFNRGMIPDSPSEPDVVPYQVVEPQIMPLIDVTGNPDAIHDFTEMPWPEPRGSPPHSGNDMSDMQFPSFNQFPSFVPTNNIGNMGNMPMGSMGNMNNMPMGPMGNINNINMGNMGMGPPHLMPPFNPMMGPPDMNPMPPFGPNGGPPMGPNFGPNGPNFMNNFGPPMHMNDNNNRGGRNGPNWGKPNNMNWQPPPMGGPNGPNGRPNWIGGNSGGNNNKICIKFQRGGYCRHGDRCKFLHPGVNCPPI